MPDKITAAGPARIRTLNRKAVLSYIRKNGPTSRAELIPALKLSTSAISSVTKELIKDGLLRPQAPDNTNATGRGRPKSPLELNPKAVYALGLRLQPVNGQCRIHMAWIDYAGQIRQMENQISRSLNRTDDVISCIQSALIKVEQEVPNRKKILAATIAIPGVVKQDEVIMAPALRSIEGHSFGSALAQNIDYPISMSNDVNLAVLSELHEQSRLSQLNFAYLYIGYGIGAGIGLHGRLFSANGWAGEVGHLRIARSAQSSLSFEQLLNPGNAFSDDTKRLGLPLDDLDGLAQAESSGDQHISTMLDDYAQIVYEMVMVLDSVLGLDEIIIDFPSKLLFSSLQPRIEALIATQPHQVVISTPTFDHGAAVHGAAIAALEVAIDHVESGSLR